MLKIAIRAHKALKSKWGRMKAKKKFEGQLRSIYLKKYEKPEIIRICKNMKRHAKENSTFFAVEGVEPTNNGAGG